MHAGRSGIGVSLGVARRKLTVTVRLPSDRTRLREVSSQPYSNALAAGLAASNKGQALSCSLFQKRCDVQAIAFGRQGVCCKDACRDDVCLFRGGIAQVGAVRLFAGGELRAFRQREGFRDFLPVRVDDDERAVLHRRFRGVVQDIPAVELRPTAEAGVEAFRDTAIISDEGEQQGERGIQIAALFNTCNVFAAFLLYVRHRAEHSVVGPVHVVQRGEERFWAGFRIPGNGFLQLFEQLSCHFHGRAFRCLTAAPVDVFPQAAGPSRKLVFQVVRVFGLGRGAASVHEGVHIATHILLQDVHQYRQHMVLPQ